MVIDAKSILAIFLGYQHNGASSRTGLWFDDTFLLHTGNHLGNSISVFKRYMSHRLLDGWVVTDVHMLLDNTVRPNPASSSVNTYALLARYWFLQTAELFGIKRASNNRSIHSGDLALTLKHIALL